jgi:hypothetical protein
MLDLYFRDEMLDLYFRDETDLYICMAAPLSPHYTQRTHLTWCHSCVTLVVMGIYRTRYILNYKQLQAGQVLAVSGGDQKQHCHISQAKSPVMRLMLKIVNFRFELIFPFAFSNPILGFPHRGGQIYTFVAIRHELTKLTGALAMGLLEMKDAILLRVEE